MVTQRRKESDQISLPCQIAELTVTPAASQMCKHHLPAAGNGPGAVGDIMQIIAANYPL